MQAEQQVRDFGKTRDGQIVRSIDIGQGTLSARILTYGATLQDLRLQGIEHPLILGWPEIAGYEDSTAYLGAMVGRCANRIARASYSLDGASYQLDRNYLGTHTLHGGTQGMDCLVWEISSVTSGAVTLQLTLPDGHMGFGGDLEVTVTFRVEADATLSIKMEARTTSESLCNVTPHIYFNLGGGTATFGGLGIRSQFLPVRSASALSSCGDADRPVLGSDDAARDYRTGFAGLFRCGFG